MTNFFFNSQMQRLKSQWPSGYGQERMALIWNAFQGVLDEIFRDAVSELIASSRSCPLIPDLEKAVSFATRRENEVRTQASYGFTSALTEASDNNKTADPEFVKACMQLTQDKLNGKIKMAEFLQGCGYLDEVAAQLSGRRKI